MWLIIGAVIFLLFALVFMVSSGNELLEMLLTKKLERLRVGGACPHCGTDVLAPRPSAQGGAIVQPAGFDCPACARRVLLRDGQRFEAI